MLQFRELVVVVVVDAARKYCFKFRTGRQAKYKMYLRTQRQSQS